MLFRTQSQLQELKAILKNDFPTFMTNLLKITLTKQEERLAIVILAYYKTSVTDETLRKAIELN